METQTRSSRHNKFISAENIIAILSVSSDDSLHAFLLYHHHHLVVPSAWISLTLSHHPSLSFIASGRSSGLYPVSAQSCCM